MLAAAFGIEAFAHAQAATNKPSSTPIAGNSQSLPVAYQKWADEDVVWIITPEERARFMSLTSDAERNQFIRQFWQRRDVEASSNGKADFRKTYYQRIAYANQHFNAAGTPGWKTARGRIYIMYGPPDSIDAHLVAVGDYEALRTLALSHDSGIFKAGTGAGRRGLQDKACYQERCRYEVCRHV